MTEVKKYIFVNGIMKLNPEYKAQQAKQGKESTLPDGSLAIVSSTQDIMDANAVQTAATGKPLQLAESTTASMDIIQDSEFLDKFKSPQKLDGGEVLDKLSNIFAKYEVPIGLVNKLLALSEYKLNMLIDDSGSMQNETDAKINQASDFMRQKCDPQGKRANSHHNNMTRWEEAEDRLHVMIDILAYIPTEPITITFLNRADRVVLDHTGKTPEQFAQLAHEAISKAFNKSPFGSTPIYSKLAPMLTQSYGNTMHYLFTDGEPTDASVDRICKLVLERPNPQKNPLTFMSCTNEDDQCEWMKAVEEQAPYTAELDDYEGEKREVRKDQGPGLPFSRGFWLLCQLAAAINPEDLDAMDESVPLSKFTLDALMGRKITSEEYRYYFQNNPHASRYNHLYDRFEREEQTAAQILKNQPRTLVSQPASFWQPAPIVRMEEERNATPTFKIS